MDKDTDQFPIDGEESPDRVRHSLRLDREDDAKFQLIVETFNQMSRAIGRKGRKWSAMSVLERFVKLEIDAFYAKHGEYPTTAEGRAELTRRAVADLKKKVSRK